MSPLQHPSIWICTYSVWDYDVCRPTDSTLCLSLPKLGQQWLSPARAEAWVEAIELFLKCGD